MALTYRSPLEENVAAYDSTVQATIASTSAVFYRDAEQDHFKFFNYHLSPVAKRKLIEAGLYLSPYSAVPHSHPACKTLENHILFTVLPPLLDNSFFFVGIKQFKLDMIKTRDSQLSMISKINRYVTSLDKARYGSDLVVRSTPVIPGLRRHNPNLEGPTLKNLVPSLMVKSAKKLFFHDELHYWNHRELLTFLEVIKPEVIYATIVYPPELLKGSNVSLNKWCYEFEVTSKDLFFFPDGARTEGYQQPLNGGFLLKTHSILLGDGEIYKVDLVHSKFAHHLIMISRGNGLGPTVRNFGPFEATSCKGLEPLLRGVNHCFPISFEVVSRVYRYLRTLKKPDAQSAMAKLSQLLPEPTGFEIKFLQDFAELVINTSTICTLIKPDRLSIFLGTWLRALPNFIAERIKRVRSLSLDEFVQMLEPYTFSCKLEVLSWSSDFHIELFDLSESAFNVDLVNLIDQGFSCGLGDAIPDRVSNPYIGLLTNFQKQPILSMRTDSFDSLVRRIFLREFVTASSRKISCREVSAYISRKIRASRNCIFTTKAFLIKLLDHGRVQRIIHSCLSIYAKELRVQFFDGVNLWFLSPDRGYQKFLTDCISDGQFVGGAGVKFASIVADVVNFNRSSLKKRRTNPCSSPHTLIDNRNPGPIRSTMKEQNVVVSPTTAPPEVYERGVDMVQTCESPELIINAKYDIADVCCACGLSINVHSLPLIEPNDFKAPDPLRGRHAGWYNKGEKIDYKYTGGYHKSLGWPDWLEEWAFVNGINTEYYNCCLFQTYDQGAIIPFHSDDEEIFTSGASIYTCNIGGDATFTLKCNVGVVTIDLRGGCAFTMPPGCQESHKHSVQSLTMGRKSLTFRNLRRKSPIDIARVTEIETSKGDHGSLEQDIVVTRVEKQSPWTREFMIGTIAKENLAVPADYETIEVPGDGNCFWYALEKITEMNWREIKKSVSLVEINETEFRVRLLGQLIENAYAEDEAILCAALVLRAQIQIIEPHSGVRTFFNPNVNCTSILTIELLDQHFRPIRYKNLCVPTAISLALGRNVNEVLQIMVENLDPRIFDEILGGFGVEVELLDFLFGLFGIKAYVITGENYTIMNEEGRFEAQFKLFDDHLEFMKRTTNVSVKLMDSSDKLRTVNPGSLNELSEAGSVLKFLPDYFRAKTLADCLELGNTGVLHSKLFNDASNLIDAAQELRSQERDIITILGTFGSGKSTLMLKFFKKNPGNSIFYVSPRKALADDFSSKLFTVDQLHGTAQSQRGRRNGKKRGDSKNWWVVTFEVFLKRVSTIRGGAAVILDEIQLYPPGFLDLISLLLHEEVVIIVGGDPCQSDYDSEKDRMWLGSLKSDAEVLLENKEYNFNMLSRRFLNRNWFGRLPCEFDQKVLGEKICDSEHLLFLGLDQLIQVPSEFQECFLVSSFEEKKIVTTHFPKRECVVLTFGESTGMTFNFGTIIITNVSASASENRWITALSRFRTNLCLVNLVGTSWESLARSFKGRALHRFVSKTADKSNIIALLPGRPKLRNGFSNRIGKDEGLREEKVAGDPWLKGLISLYQIEDVEEAEEYIEELPEEWFKTHLPRDELESVRASWVHKIMAKEFREVRMGYLVSEQFTDEYAKEKAVVLTNAAERFEAIYPRHRANDSVTFFMAVKKRLRFSRPATEKAKLIEAQAYAPFLLQEFLKRIKLKPEHNKNMMAKALANFEEKKTSKSAATIENHSGRSCRDWLLDIGLVFSKSQLCTKFDNRFRVAKAAQSIVCFQHEVLCRFAPYMRYIEMKLIEALPANYYIHSGKGLDELNAWVKTGKFDGICTESDYEAFDASQDQYIVAFEIAIMKFLGLPNDLIEDYRFIKTHLGSKLGNFAIMRFSGEASTFLFNTMANMLFTFLRYEIRGREFICFAGDDMCASEQLSLKKEHEGFLSKLKLKAKVFMVSKPTFCGWHLSPDGIYKKPQLVLERMCIAKEKNNLSNCIDNYAIEVSYAYRLGEKVLNRMDEEEAAAFYNCVRIIVKNKHLLKSSIADLYSDNSI